MVEMRTSKEYTANLKSGIITKEMLADYLYSINKVASDTIEKQDCIHTKIAEAKKRIYDYEPEYK